METNYMGTIYIDWNMGNHTYKMTLHLWYSWSLESLEKWIEYNGSRVESWSFDERFSTAKNDKFDKVRFLINSNLNK